MKVVRVIPNKTMGIKAVQMIPMIMGMMVSGRDSSFKITWRIFTEMNGKDKECGRVKMFILYINLALGVHIILVLLLLSFIWQCVPSGSIFFCIRQTLNLHFIYNKWIAHLAFFSMHLCQSVNGMIHKKTTCQAHQYLDILRTSSRIVFTGLTYCLFLISCNYLVVIVWLATKFMNPIL